MTNRTYRILLDSRWTLEELTNFSRVYFQNYSFLYCLEAKSVGVASDRIAAVLASYELRHGLSYVNIYDIFRANIPVHDKPQIKSIAYASPGWIDLLLNPEVALKLAEVVGAFLATAASTAATYKALHKIYLELNELRTKHRNKQLKLETDMVQQVTVLNDQLAKGLGFESLQELDEHTKDIEESSKLLMAHYRRLQKMVVFVTQGKVSFPQSLEDQSKR